MALEHRGGASSDCTGCVLLYGQEMASRKGWRWGVSLFGGFVWFQELLGEFVDLVGTSDFVGQQRQFDYMEIFVEVLHLWREDQPSNRTMAAVNMDFTPSRHRSQTHTWSRYLD